VTDNYHSSPALSSSGARKLLPPSCPARFKWERDNPPPPRDVFDFGHAAHRFVLGKGEEIARLDFLDRRTNAYKREREAARAVGMVPLLAADYAVAVAMAKAVRDHPIASKLLADGDAEVVKEWADEKTGTPLRTMFDWLSATASGPVRIVDYKTAKSADPGSFTRSAFNYGYHIQQAWYVDTMIDAGATDVEFTFIVQEKEPPYLVSVVRLDEMALQIGRAECRKAIDIFAHCVETDTWPGYADGIVTVETPAWATSRYLDAMFTDEIEV